MAWSGSGDISCFKLMTLGDIGIVSFVLSLLAAAASCIGLVSAHSQSSLSDSWGNVLLGVQPCCGHGEVGCKTIKVTT